MHSSKRSLRPGFTLIELLVVIAIIAILAAILFPVFAQAREKARAIACISNLKQMGLGVMQYTQDYDETYPMAEYCVQGTYDSCTNGQHEWSDVIQPYIKNGSQDKNADGSTSNYGTGGVFSCPSAVDSKQPFNYGVHWDISQEGQPFAGEGSAVITTTLAAIQNPSDLIYIAEKGHNNTGPVGGTWNAGNWSWPFFTTYEWQWVGDDSYVGSDGSNADNYQHKDVTIDCDNGDPNSPDAYTCSTMPRYRHNKTCNVVFADGHAKAMQLGRINWWRNIYPGPLSGYWLDSYEPY